MERKEQPDSGAKMSICGQALRGQEEERITPLQVYVEAAVRSCLCLTPRAADYYLIDSSFNSPSPLMLL